MKLTDFDYNLPEELIAQFPAEKRAESRLLVYNRASDTIEHRKFFNIIEYLTSNDLVVLNNTKVFPARLFGKKDTGAKIEVFLLKKDKLDSNKWTALVKPAKRLKPGSCVLFDNDFGCEIIEKYNNGEVLCRFDTQGKDIFIVLEEQGHIPLPPYIKRQANQKDRQTYQTVYASEMGSVAAPTAGLHFTPEIIANLKEKGVQFAEVTLHVGLGTFRPISCENIADHEMHYEYYEIDEDNSKIINEAIRNGKRIIATGTTSIRTLESAVNGGKILPCSNETNLYIKPGYEFKVVNGIITNFHLPKSSLLVLVSAFAGRDNILKVYNEAIKREYRFFSYGDAMLLL